MTASDRIQQNVIRATYRIVTPMFLGGAEQQPELRLASFKGALRFWWRSLMWGRVKDHHELSQREAGLFGASDEKVGQSKVHFQVKDQKLSKRVDVGQVFENGKLSGAHYLAYGVMEAFPSHKKGTESGQLTRAMIPGGVFEVECVLSPKLSASEREQLIGALVLVGTIGGLGSKSRKGYGSLTLNELVAGGKSRSFPTDAAERLRQVMSSLDSGQPEWSAWSKQSRVVTVSASGAQAVDVLDLLGREQLFYRGWGHHGKVLGEDSEKNFVHDHNLYKGLNTSIRYPLRVAFGLPHNYEKGFQGEVAPASAKLDRRASPLFLHVDQAADKAPPIGVLAFLPARFLPAGELIRAFGKTQPLDQSDAFWRPIHGYLDRLIGKPEATPKKTKLKGQEVSLV